MSMNPPSDTAAEALTADLQRQLVEKEDQFHGAKLHVKRLAAALSEATARAEKSDQQIADLRAQVERMTAVVKEQANDEGLWFQPVHITEDYLQKALRRLHEAVEGKSARQCAMETVSKAAAVMGETL